MHIGDSGICFSTRHQLPHIVSLQLLLRYPCIWNDTYWNVLVRHESTCTRLIFSCIFLFRDLQSSCMWKIIKCFHLWRALVYSLASLGTKIAKKTFSSASTFFGVHALSTFQETCLKCFNLQLGASLAMLSQLHLPRQKIKVSFRNQQV